jgi:hypothetical protein
MPCNSAHAPKLSLFVSDPAASPEALARYEALRPVLTGQRSRMVKKLMRLCVRNISEAPRAVHGTEWALHRLGLG